MTDNSTEALREDDLCTARAVAMLGDMFGALEAIVHLTHDSRNLTSRQVNRVAFSAIARVLAAGGPLPASTPSNHPDIES